MHKIKKGDEVVIIAGKDKGKRGAVLSVLNKGMSVIVDGINLVKKHVKANPNANERGGIISKAMPVHRSNVMLYDSAKQKRSRVGVRVLNDGQRERYLKVSGELVDTKV